MKRSQPLPFTVQKYGRNVHVVKVYVASVAKSWKQRFLLMSDNHHDNLLCNQELEKKHLKEAKADNAGILFFGDLFCAMQGKWDKRADQDQLREELRGNDYLNLLVDYAKEFFLPYSKNIIMIGYGNHETKLEEKHGFDIIADLVARLNERSGSNITTGGYSGYVKFEFIFASSNAHASKLLWYHHGSGGNAPVTKGVLQTARHAAFLTDADIVVSGHNHNEFIFPITRIRLNKQYHIEKSRQLHVKIPGYKDGFADGAKGWENQKGFSPTSCGSCWLEFTADRERNIYVEPQLTLR